MKEVIEQIEQIINQLYDQAAAIKLERTKPEFGDFALNVAMQLAPKLQQNPRQIAEAISQKLDQLDVFKSVEVAGPGFINLKLSDQAIVKMWQAKLNKIYDQQSVVVEYSDPNPFKVLHAGHLYTSVVGDAIANLVERGGGQVHRANFGGDVGLHVGKTMWAIIQKLGGELPDELAKLEPNERIDWIAKRYVEGSAAYENYAQAHAEIVAYNQRVYQLHKDNDHQSPFAQIYWTCREWSYQYFKDFYARIGSGFDKYYPESATADRGLIEVKQRIGTVFEESDGAIIFDGDKYDLHTRVFINKQGLPTYETKDIGLVFQKYDDYKFDKSIIITADEQKHYMEVVLKALEQFAPELALNTIHITHGLVKLAGGVKMSSRKGNFLRAIDVLNFALEANEEQNNVSDEQVALGAIKYAFLKPRIGGDIIYDPNESVSLIGNSGPYLQYAHARASSILAKAKSENKLTTLSFDQNERPLAVKLGEYAEVINQAIAQLAPHLICTYLYELAQEFNRFYEKAKIIGDGRQAERLELVKKYQQVLADGLELLGIKAIKEM